MTFDDHIEKICSIHPDWQGNVLIDEDDKDGYYKNKELLMFYWDEEESAPIKDSPSFKNAFFTIIK